MSAKKNRKQEQESSPPDTSETMRERRREKELRDRFGAVAFVEDISSSPEDEQPVSLDALRAAFAEIDATEVSGGTFDEEEILEPLSGSPSDITDDRFEDEDDFDDEEPNDDSSMIREPIEEIDGPEGESTEPNPRSIVEAMLFVGNRENRPLDVHRAAEKMRNVSPEEIHAIMADLEQNYRRRGCPYGIEREEGSYRMVLRAGFSEIRARFYGRIREARLSQQAIDTLAVVAYRQPISADEVQNIRKQPAAAILGQLVKRGLLCIEKENRGKKIVPLYRTTERFLELFQLDSIDDLPIAEEIDFR